MSQRYSYLSIIQGLIYVFGMVVDAGVQNPDSILRAFSNLPEALSSDSSVCLPKLSSAKGTCLAQDSGPSSEIAMYSITSLYRRTKIWLLDSIWDFSKALVQLPSSLWSGFRPLLQFLFLPSFVSLPPLSKLLTNKPAVC